MVPIKRTTRKPAKKVAAKSKNAAAVKRQIKGAKRPVAKKAAARKGAPRAIAKALRAHPATTAMIARINNCRLPPIKWEQGIDGGWMEATLQSDCTYGEYVAVDASQVPEKIRNG